MGQNLFESLQKLDILKELAFLVYKNIISSILGFMGQQENLRLQLSQSSASSLEPCHSPVKDVGPLHHRGDEAPPFRISGASAN